LAEVSGSWPAISLEVGWKPIAFRLLGEVEAESAYQRHLAERGQDDVLFALMLIPLDDEQTRRTASAVAALR